MSAEILQFDEWAGSGRGLFARPIILDNKVAVKDDIDSIDFAVYRMGSSDSPVTGILDVNQVMLAAPSGPGTWNKDKIGYTFFWDAPGTLWPLPISGDGVEQYRVLIFFHTKPALGSKIFVRVWQVTTRAPSG